MESTSSDDFWLESSHKGFDFGDVSTSSGDSKVSAFLKSNVSNQFTPLRYKGLDEVLESNSSADSFSRISSGESSSQTSKTSKATEDRDPLLIVPKKRTMIERPGVEDVVRNMIFGLDYSLHNYKSKRDKLALLEAAIKTHDGNAILEVVLYMRNTLKKSIFQREIVAFPSALNVYLAYLEEDHNNEELMNTLLLANKADDAAFLKYEAAVAIEDPDRKLQRIGNCLSTHFQVGSTDSLSRYLVEEHYNILREQIEFVKSNLGSSFGETEMAQFENLTGRKSLIDSPVMNCLIYSCLFHYKSQESSHIFASPQKLMASCHLTKKQFTWAALRALASLQKWPEINELFMSKNWLGNIKIRSCIHLPRVLETLSKAQAPSEVLSKYVSAIENDEEKMELAKKYACHAVIIEVLKNNKDRLGLIKYKSALEPHSPDLIKLIEALNNPTIRWKN